MVGTKMEQLFFPEAMGASVEAYSAALVAEARGITVQIVDKNNARVQVGDHICYLSVDRALHEVIEALQQLRVDLGAADGE